jgi:hypothetical protein
MVEVKKQQSFAYVSNMYIDKMDLIVSVNIQNPSLFCKETGFVFGFGIIN